MLDRNKKQTVDYLGPDFALGRHITIEYYDCAPDVLLDRHRVETILLEAAQKSGATIVSSSFHQFEPQGVSGVVIIAESHFTVHAWPEHDYAAVDIFTCADTIDLDTAIDAMKTQFLSRRVVISSDQNRGILPSGVQNRAARCDKKVMDRDTLPITWTKVSQDTNSWGVSTSVDLYDCNADLIKDSDHIKGFVKGVCEQLDISGQENAPLVYCDENQTASGFSVIQSAGPAGISGHFAHGTQRAYLDIFSCKQYEPRKIAEFALSYFKSSHYKMRVALRK